MTSKKVIAVLLSVLFLVIAVSCSASRLSQASPMERPVPAADEGVYTTSKNFSGADYEIAEDTLPPGEAGIQAYDAAAGREPAATQPQEIKAMQKLIYRSQYEIETTQYEDSIELIESLVNEFGGYIESSRLSGNRLNSESSSRYGSYILRIPSDKLSEFDNKSGDIGNIINKSTDVENVTQSYTDVEARLKSSRIKEERILSILEKATELKDIAELENILSDVRYEIESLESSKRSMDSLISYSVVTINLYEVMQTTEVRPLPKTLGERIAARFSSTLEGFSRNMQSFAVFIIGDSPVILFWAAIIVGAYFIIRRIFVKSKKVKKQDTEDQD